MKYGICPIAVAPVRLEPRDASEMVTQALYGEHFKIIDTRKNWLKIRLAHDNYEGWIDSKQVCQIESEIYHNIQQSDCQYSTEIIGHVTHQDNTLSTITMGAQISTAPILSDTFDLNHTNHTLSKDNIITYALQLINTPYLWGGRTPLGIDCSGFTQLIYRLSGYKLFRDASQQATQGEVLSFIEEAQEGDLAFFDNTEGVITHVGIIMKDNYIIHAHGKVRIDRLDQSGIFNTERCVHTHKLRVIKKMI